MKTARELVHNFEGCRLRAYRCPGGQWTIGYGHTRGVTPEMQCTCAQAEEWLDEDLAEAARTVDELVKVPLTNNQREALIIFVFNVGANNFRYSSLLRYLNAGDYERAAKEFDKWIYSKGATLPGLITRRLAEKELFTTSDS